MQNIEKRYPNNITNEYIYTRIHFEKKKKQRYDKVVIQFK